MVQAHDDHARGRRLPDPTEDVLVPSTGARTTRACADGGEFRFYHEQRAEGSLQLPCGGSTTDCQAVPRHVAEGPVGAQPCPKCFP